MDAEARRGAQRFGRAVDILEARARKPADDRVLRALGDCVHGLEIAMEEIGKSRFDDIDAHLRRAVRRFRFFLQASWPRPAIVRRRAMWCRRFVLFRMSLMWRSWSCNPSVRLPAASISPFVSSPKRRFRQCETAQRLGAAKEEKLCLRQTEGRTGIASARARDCRRKFRLSPSRISRSPPSPFRHSARRVYGSLTLTIGP